MVGVPTSKRCENCRKRKKKCGEEKPGCIQCKKSGWVCSGYATTWKFVDELPLLTKHYARRKYIYDSVDLSLEEVYSEYLNRGAMPNGMVVVRKNLLFLHSGVRTDQAQARLCVPRYLEIDRLGSELAYCLESQVRGTLLPLSIVGSFVDLIPSRLGYSAALDDAVSCICALYRERVALPYIFNKDIYKSYVKALSSLRSCLADSTLCMAAETLCASVILQLCELIINDGEGEWTNLSRGSCLLLQSRGAHCYKTAFEHAILHSQLHYVVAQSIKYKESCFLCFPEWQGLVSSIPEWPDHSTLRAQSITLRSRLSQLLIQLPSIILDVQALHQMDIYTLEWEQKSNLVLKDASKLLSSLKKWFELEADPILSYNITSHHSQYPDLLVGVSYCVGNNTLVTINKAIRSIYNDKLTTNTLSPKRQQALFHSLDPPEVCQGQFDSATDAFQYVLEESPIAAKPLDFGMKHAKFSAY